MSFEAIVHAKAIQLDQLALDMTAAAGSGHPTSAMSLGQIVTVLLYQSMRWLPSDPTCPTSDRLVLSEGHAVPIVYAACADLGTLVGKDPATRRPLSIDDLKTLRNADSVLDGHPNPAEGFPFFDAATGSLGQGLSIAAGLGLAARQDGLDRRIWCIIGDGESREGQIWEALEFLVDKRLTNVVPIFNCNQYGQADKVSSLQSPEVIAAKLGAIGIVALVIDGHDPKQIKEAFDKAAKATQVHAVVARTVKGWGSPTMQGGGWHGKPASGEKLRIAKEELDAVRLKLTSALAAGAPLKPPAPPPVPAAVPAAAVSMSFPEAMKAFDMASTMATGRFATRKAYGLALRALGRANPAIWALDADVKNSTFAEWFANDRELSSRFVECKIAEQNMASVAVGLSAAGKIPFASSFAKFLTRAYDQIEMGLNTGANFKLVGSHSGITPCSDGPSQMALPDVAWFRSLASVRDHRGNPGCYVLQPSDAWSAYALTQVMAEYEGLCYLRTFRPEVEFLYGPDTVFNLGKFEVLTEGRDLMIVTAGYMVHECNKAIAELDRMGIDATLVDLYSIPFDADAFLDLANRNGGNILTVEDNYGAGIGGAVAEACCDAGDAFTVRQLFVRRIPKSCRTEDEVMAMCGLDPKSIVAAAAEMVGVRQ